MKFLLISWFFLLAFISIHLDADRKLVNGQCLNDQRLLLTQLNQSLSSPSISNLATASFPSKRSSWDMNTDCCSSWVGVGCDKDGHVIALDLSDDSLSGGLDNTSSLFKLHHLQSLNLAYNSFDTKLIPSGFDQLANLTYLNMSNSGFTGQIPVDIARLTKLVSLDLSAFLPGESPLKLEDPDLGTLVRHLSHVRELRLDGVNISAEGSIWGQALSSSLPDLQVLSLSNCYLSGPLDPSLSKLQSLYEIRLDQNHLSSVVPEFFVSFSNLTSLQLRYCGLYGKFPEKILQLPMLQSLSLSNNKLLRGSLPEFLPNASLQTLVLSDTNFSGGLPNSIGNLKFLSHLELQRCNFNGSIPASMANLNQLQYLDLSSNHFIGPIPSSSLMGWSQNLTQISLAHNRFEGPISPHWDKLLKLVSLNLRNNSLNGTISPTLFTLPSLQKLELAQNRLTGQLGEFPNGSSPLLDTLDLSSNRLEGPIPLSIFEFSSLKILTLSSNMFNGTLSLNMFQKFSNLSSLDLSANRLSVNISDASSALFPQLGTLKLSSCNLRVFPDFLRNQSLLTQLELSGNQIRGKIPGWISTLGNGTLSHLNLSINFLEDPERPFPDGSFRWLSMVDLHSNMLQGKNLILPSSASFLDYSHNNLTSIPTNIGSYLQVTIFFSLTSNNLVGEIPTSICETRYLQVLDLSNNRLSGSIPPCLVSIASLGVLNLRRNNFSGTIPMIFDESCSLRTLDLNENRLEGQVATSLANCTMLQVIDLGNNQIGGVFPYWLRNLSQLRVLVLRSNRFHGPFGHGLTENSFPTLQIIDISYNNFSGHLYSDYFSSWKGMILQEDQSDYKQQLSRFGFLGLSGLYYHDAVTVTSKGLDMELVKILSIFTSIDMSNNQFEGEIPEVTGSLSSLYILNLSRNALTCQIPSSLGNLMQLESLDLSENKLSGQIPMSLKDLSFLSFLNLSYNNLVGRIPDGTQIQTFSATSFEGNDGLCGAPLSKSCTNTVEEGPAPASKHMGSNSKLHFDWQLILITSTGYVGGVGMVVGPLLLLPKGRKWFIKL